MENTKINNVLSENEIEEALNKAYKQAKDNAYFGNGFRAGVEFVVSKSKWINVDDKLPNATEKRRWDGKRSELVIAETKDGTPQTARIYEGFLDGEDFCVWCDARGNVIKNVVRWCEIPV